MLNSEKAAIFTNAPAIPGTTIPLTHSQKRTNDGGGGRSSQNPVSRELNAARSPDRRDVTDDIPSTIDSPLLHACLFHRPMRVVGSGIHSRIATYFYNRVLEFRCVYNSPAVIKHWLGLRGEECVVPVTKSA